MEEAREGSAKGRERGRRFPRRGKKIYEHRCTGCTGLTGRKLPAREAGSGNDRVWICGCSGLQASRFLKKSCASCASMLITQSNDARNSGRQAPETKSCGTYTSMQIIPVTHEAAGSPQPARPRASPWSRRLPLQWGVAETEPRRRLMRRGQMPGPQTALRAGPSRKGAGLFPGEGVRREKF